MNTRMRRRRRLNVGRVPVLNNPPTMESNSSKKRAHGAAAAARRNTARTPASLWPMYLLSSSGPFTEIILSPAEATAARASSVLPHPGVVKQVELQR